MKSAVAIHEAGHAAAILSLPIRIGFKYAKIFNCNGEWRGETRIDSRSTGLSSACLKACDFTKSIAGPMAQLKYASNSVNLAIREPIEKYGFLEGIWWLYENRPDTEVAWASDIRTWMQIRAYNSPMLESCNSYEEAVEQWLSTGSTKHSIQAIADILMEVSEVTLDLLNGQESIQLTPIKIH